MRRSLLLFLLILPFLSKGQNYQCLISGTKQYYTNANGYLRGCRIDSIHTYTDSVIYYPYHTPRGHYGMTLTTLDSTGGSWLGKNATALNDGSWLFSNLWNDTIIVKTNAHTGDNWIFYNDTSALYYLATVTGEDTMTIAGTPDSIKNILITARNSMGIVTSDPADSFNIVVSKHNGFVQVFDLYTFPYHAPGITYAPGNDFYLDHLCGAGSAPTKANSLFSLISLINPTFQQLYQWNTGDVYEYASCSDLFEHYGAICNPVEYYYMDTVKATSITTSSTIYDYSGWSATYSAPLPVSTTSFPIGPYYYTTIPVSSTLNCNNTLLIDTVLMPEELHQKKFYYYKPNDTSYCITSTLYKTEYNDEINSNVYSPPFEVYGGYQTYKSPLGLLNSFSASQNIGSIVYAQHLIYHDRAGAHCGSLLNPTTGINDVDKVSANINLFPNPATNELTITGTDIESIALYNVLGQIISRTTCNCNKTTLNVSRLIPGLYFIKVNDTQFRIFEKQ